MRGSLSRFATTHALSAASSRNVAALMTMRFALQARLPRRTLERAS